MIGRLRGKLVGEDQGGALLVDVGGVGYEVAAPLGTAARAKSDGADEVLLHVHLVIREDAHELYGFASDLERRTFRLLIAVPNVGPKTALAVLSAMALPELGRAVAQGDLGRLVRVPGVGKRTAERLVLELKEKMPRLELYEPESAAGPRAAKEHPRDADRLLGALVNMGYRASEAERAITGLGARVGKEPIDELLRDALAELAL